MTLAAENIALKAENARLREALAKYATGYDFIFYDRDNDIIQEGFVGGFADSLGNAAADALAQPTPTTPETDKAQAVINAACAHHINSHYGGPDLLCDCGICKAVEAYRGGA